MRSGYNGIVLTILDGSTFCLSDEIGDFDSGACGLFANDTRMLSRCLLLVDGAKPLLLTSRATEYFSSRHFLRNPVTPALAADVLTIVRERSIGETVHERILVRNETAEPIAVEVALELASDFADILSVKAHDFTFGDPLHAPPLPVTRECRTVAAGVFRIADEDGYWTEVTFSQEPMRSDQGVSYRVALGPHASWDVTFDFTFGFGGDDGRGTSSGGSEPRSAWQERVPRLTTTAAGLQRAYERSIADLASLRLRGIEAANEFPAAGMPWFMTLFGRDTLITSLQTLVFGPELATGALRSLAALPARADDASIDAEPGKILHELRRGKAATAWFPLYYGTADATPLFLILLSELWRWSGDGALAAELEPAARAALDWIDRFGDRDGDGFVEYCRRTSRGLENQSWKDSGDSQRFRDGMQAEPPIAPVEVQGYVFDAKRRCSEIAREVWGDTALAERLAHEAHDLQRRFDDAFWLPERGTYALALDRDKRPVDSLCSNIGHLLWSGIVPAARRELVAETLMDETLWSGWGIRTMSTRDTAYNPLSYHNGTVWPHDTTFAAWGLAGSGFREAAWTICRGLVDAATYFDHTLPEVFAGYPRSLTTFPVAYPTAARPQAWAAGAPVLCLTVLLGLRPDPAAGRLEIDPSPPEWIGRTKLQGVRALGRVWDVEIRDGAGEVHQVG